MDSMKCIKPADGSETLTTNGENQLVIRVKDKTARKLVNSGHYVYCEKSEWKANGRHRS